MWKERGNTDECPEVPRPPRAPWIPSIPIVGVDCNVCTWTMKRLSGQGVGEKSDQALLRMAKGDRDCPEASPVFLTRML